MSCSIQLFTGNIYFKHGDKLFKSSLCSSFENSSNSSYITKQQFTQHARISYNSLNRGITLSPNKPLFKKWLLRSHYMTEFDKFLLRDDNRITLVPVFSTINIATCSN